MAFDKNLDERKKIILKTIIDDYVITIEPIGSRTLANKYDLGLSAATIRNEMADLEDMGYLSQPHTSSGRIPSEKGYRHYVDHMMNITEPDLSEMQKIKSSLEHRIGELNEFIRLASGVISQITQYTSIAVTPSMRKLSIKALQIVPVEKGKALVIVVMADGAVKNKLINIDVSITAELLILLSNIVNEKFCGYPVEQISIILINDIVGITGIEREKILPIIDGIIDCMRKFEASEVYTDGAANILNHPEFCDINKARELMSFLNSDEMLIELMSRDLSNDLIDVKIGKENNVNQMSDCTLITATYSFNKNIVGTIGILGPIRMDYSKVISSMEYVRKKMNKEIIKLIGELSP